jgi:hypothetical protein
MDDKDMILAMAICDLLGKSVTGKEVEKAFEAARKKLERSSQPPRPAKVTHAHRRD